MSFRSSSRGWLIVVAAALAFTKIGQGGMNSLLPAISGDFQAVEQWGLSGFVLIGAIVGFIALPFLPVRWAWPLALASAVALLALSFSTTGVHALASVVALGAAGVCSQLANNRMAELRPDAQPKIRAVEAFLLVLGLSALIAVSALGSWRWSVRFAAIGWVVIALLLRSLPPGGKQEHFRWRELRDDLRSADVLLAGFASMAAKANVQVSFTVLPAMAEQAQGRWFVALLPFAALPAAIRLLRNAKRRNIVTRARAKWRVPFGAGADGWHAALWLTVLLAPGIGATAVAWILAAAILSENARLAEKNAVDVHVTRDGAAESYGSRRAIIGLLGLIGGAAAAIVTARLHHAQGDAAIADLGAVSTLGLTLAVVAFVIRLVHHRVRGARSRTSDPRSGDARRTKEGSMSPSLKSRWMRHGRAVRPVSLRRYAGLAVLGLSLAVVDHTIYYPGLLGDDLAEELPFGGYVGACAAGAQLAGVLLLLWIAVRVGRRRFGGVAGAITALALGVAAVWPSGLPLVLSLLVSSMFGVGLFAFWSRGVDAADGERERMKVAATLFVSYALGLYGLAGGTDWIDDEFGLRAFFVVYAGLVFCAVAAMVWLSRSEDALDARPWRELFTRQFKGLLDPRTRRPLLIALCSGFALLLVEAQITGVCSDLGLSRGFAAFSGLAMPVGGVIAVVATWLRPSSIRPLLRLGALLVLVGFVLGAAAAVSGAFVAVLLLVSRIALQAGTTLASMLVPALHKGVTFMAAVQVARGSGKLLGSFAGGGALDAGGFDATPPDQNRTAVLMLMVAGLCVAAIGVWLSWRECRLGGEEVEEVSGEDVEEVSGVEVEEVSGVEVEEVSGVPIVAKFPSGRVVIGLRDGDLRDYGYGQVGGIYHDLLKRPGVTSVSRAVAWGSQKPTDGAKPPTDLELRSTLKCFPDVMVTAPITVEPVSTDKGETMGAAVEIALINGHDVDERSRKIHEYILAAYPPLGFFSIEVRRNTATAPPAPVC